MIHKYHNFRLEYTLALPNYPPPPSCQTKRASDNGKGFQYGGQLGRSTRQTGQFKYFGVAKKLL